MGITTLSNKLAKVDHIAIAPVKIDEARPRDECYIVLSFKHGGRIVKKPNGVGLIVKNRKTCVFSPRNNLILTAESLAIINHFVRQIKNYELWFDKKASMWR